MTVVTVLILTLLARAPAAAQTARTAQTPGPKIADLPLARKPAPPAITLRRALKMAEQHIKKNGLSVKHYYLNEAKLIAADAATGVTEAYWWFRWVKPGGDLGDSLQIGVSMAGKTRLIPSM